MKTSDECAVRLLRSLAVMLDNLAGLEFLNILHHLPAYFIGKDRSFDVVYIVVDDAGGKYIEYLWGGPEVE